MAIEIIEIRPDLETITVYHKHPVEQDGVQHHFHTQEDHYTIHNEVTHDSGKVKVKGYFPVGAEIHVDTDHADIGTITITADGEALNANDVAARIAGAIMEFADEGDIHALEESEDAVTSTVTTSGINITGIALKDEQHPSLPDEVKALLTHHATR